MVTLNDAEAARILGPRYAALVADIAAPKGRETDGPIESEKAFMGKVIRLLKECGWLVYHTYDSRRSTAGFPDIVACRKGRCLVAELKTVEGDLSAFQEEWIAMFRQCAGVETYLWTPVDWTEIARVAA